MFRLLLLVLALACGLAERVNYKGHQVFRINPTKASHLEWFRTLPSAGLEMEFWQEPTKLNRPIDIRVSPKHAEVLIGAFKDLSIDYSVLHDDVQKLIDAERPTTAQRPQSSKVDWAFDRYLTLAEIHEWLGETAVACGAARCTILELGTSYEGNRLPAIKITDGSGTDKPQAAWIDAGIHAREWISPATALYIVDRFVKDFGVDPEVDTILSQYDVYILPDINADGYEYTWNTDRMWRKSRQPWSTCVGTDINRNFDFMWMTIGASDQPCSETYAGPNPYSEPEAAAVAQFIGTDNSRNFRVFITLHSYGQLWMAPMGYTCNQIPDYAELIRVGRIGANALQAVHGTVYEVGSACEILYESSGTSRDWAKGGAEGGAHIEYVYTLELPENSFILPPARILPVGEETWAGFKAMMAAIPARKN